MHTIEDLAEFARRVSPQRRAKRTWAAALPDGARRLFVRRRVRRASVTFSTSGSPRTSGLGFAPISQPPRSGPGSTRWSGWLQEWRPIPCVTQLQADVTELRLIGSHAPRYNRRSKFPERTQWIKITEEPFPRLSVVRVVRDDGATYFGPFARRQSAEDVALADLRRLPDPAVHAAAEHDHTDLGLCAGRHGPMRGAMRRHDLARWLPGDCRSRTRRLVDRRAARGARCAGAG